MKRLFGLVIATFTAANSVAATYCNGTVKAVYKWNSMPSLSIQVLMANGATTNWINMPTKSDEAMALVALTTGKEIELYWNAADVTVCVEGWAHNRPLDEFMVIKN